MRPDRWAVILPGVVAAVLFAAIAVRVEPPAPDVAGRCATAAAILLIAKMIAVVARSKADPGREARLLTFVVFVAILMGWFGAERAIADAAFNYQVHTQKTTLVATARDLSREIASFIGARRREAPPRPRAATWDADVAAWMRFDTETDVEFNTRFGARVRVAHDLLTLRGMRDPDFDAFYRLPANDFQMDIVSRRLATLADRLAKQP